VFFFLLCTPEKVIAAELHLTWEDNSSNEEGFLIERRTGTSGAFTQIAAVGENVTSYTNFGLAPGTTYCYRVRAFASTARSAYSNIDCATTSTLVATFESQENGLPVSGVTAIRGWTFDTVPESQIRRVELFIDEVSSGTIPCCSERGDVQGAFPNFAAENTLNSGWGTIFNWGLLSPGVHTVRLEISSTSGNSLRTETRAVMVVKPGGFEFLSRFDLSEAVAAIEGNELVVRGVIVRDSVSLQEKEIDARFRWFTSSQSLGMVEAVTVAEIVSRRPLFSSLLAALPRWFVSIPGVAATHAAAGIIALVESPQEGQVVSGVGVMRGWAFSETAEAAIEEVQFLVDGQPVGVIPCCAQRGDIAAAFPSYPTTINSGWGLLFNYGLLEAGPHTIGVSLRDTAGAVRTLTRNMTVIKPGNFEFLDHFDFSEATAYIAGEEIVVEGVWVRDQLTQEVKNIDARFRWVESTQALILVSAHGD
jgi:hypothetical protein